MSTQVQLRRGTAAQHATFVGAPGEITVDTTNNTLRVHDGITPGGHPLTLQALFDAHLADLAKYCKVGLTATQSIPHNVATPISWANITNYNNADFAVIENGNIKITKEGMYQVQIVPSFAGNTSGFRGINTEIGVYRVIPLGDGHGTSFVFSYFVYKSANSTLVTQAHQTSGGALDLNISTSIYIRKVV